MPRPCKICGRLTNYDEQYEIEGLPHIYCHECFSQKPMYDKGRNKPMDNVTAPTHYHKYAIDTIGMLRDGFPPEVLRGFLIGNIYKYIQRYQLKNGNEDLKKAMRYMEILMEEEVKNHSK
jgi:hypothetical protein